MFKSEKINIRSLNLYYIAKPIPATDLKFKLMKKIVLLIAVLSSQLIIAQTKFLPHLEKKDGNVQLIVNDKPFFMLSGELHNSSTGSAYYMRPIWKRMANQNLNTVIAAISWELIEPTEGNFDFSLADSMVQGARKEKLKLVLLWFGSWKNGASTYVPAWVKTDTKRFPLAKDKNGKTLNTLSTLGKNTLEADSKAFSALMKHIKEIDFEEQTVLMVQVQNEIGVLDGLSAFMGTANACMRDYSDETNKAFNGQVPAELISYLEKHKDNLYPALKEVWSANGYKQKGTWEEVFGKGAKYEGEAWKTNCAYYTEEIFMAWNYAKFVGQIAKAGKEQYALPMYANAWLKQPQGREPGKYPSGGPLPQVIDIWRAAAPSIDFIAPDIYAVEEFDWVCEEFTRSGNPLFIPETKVGPAGSARAFYAFGKYNALGYAPFGIDGAGVINTADPNDQSITKVYECLKNLNPYIQKYHGTDQMSALFIGSDKDSDGMEMGNYAISVRRMNFGGSFGLFGAQFDAEKQKEKSSAGLIAFQLADNEFLVAGGVGGIMINISKSKSNKWENIGMATVDEVSFENGAMRTHRLNGDETAFGGPVVKEGEVKIFKIKMYGY